jgi:hypothetical protein
MFIICFCISHINYSYFNISRANFFLQKIRRQRAFNIEINSNEEDDEKTEVRSLVEEKFELNGLGDDNRHNEDEVHILEKTPNYIALEEVINSGTRKRKKIDDI